jgi:hypothetical protein
LGLLLQATGKILKEYCSLMADGDAAHVFVMALKVSLFKQASQL